MSPIDHLDLVVSGAETSLDFCDPEAIELELVQRPRERHLAVQVRQLTARLERVERDRG